MPAPAPRHRKDAPPGTPPPPTRIIQSDRLPDGFDALVSQDAQTVIVRAGLPAASRRQAVRIALATAYRRASGIAVLPALWWRRFSHLSPATRIAAPAAAVVATGVAVVSVVAPQAGPGRYTVPRPSRSASVPYRRARRVDVPAAVTRGDAGRAATRHVAVIRTPPPAISPSPAPAASPSPAPSVPPSPTVSVSVQAPAGPPVCVTVLTVVTCV